LHLPIGPTRQNRVDAGNAKDHTFNVKRRISLLLLIGALLGLLAQEAAFASAPAMPMQDTAIAAPTMSAECAEMMGIDKSQDKEPCQGLTLDCIAKMGCAVPTRGGIVGCAARDRGSHAGLARSAFRSGGSLAG
jgi:hypothetical protein